MFNQHRTTQHRIYNLARNTLLEQPNRLIELEKYITECVENSIRNDLKEIEKEYNEASYGIPPRKGTVLKVEFSNSSI